MFACGSGSGQKVKMPRTRDQRRRQGRKRTPAALAQVSGQLTDDQGEAAPCGRLPAWM
jgi:hypothetical protein